MRSEMKDETQVVVNDNGNSGKISSSKFSHLLSSQDRDFLLSPTGAQKLSYSYAFSPYVQFCKLTPETHGHRWKLAVRYLAWF